MASIIVMIYTLSLCIWSEICLFNAVGSKGALQEACLLPEHEKGYLYAGGRFRYPCSALHISVVV